MSDQARAAVEAWGGLNYELCIVCGRANQAHPCGGLDGKGLGCPLTLPTTWSDNTRTPAPTEGREG